MEVEDRPESTDRPGGDVGSPRQDGENSSPNGAGRATRSRTAASKAPRRKKTPIVNRRGPNEVDKAIQMSLAKKGQARPMGRKPEGNGVSRGTVIRIDAAKGYGFLIDSAGEQRFFHRSSVLQDGFASLKEQQSVEFEPHKDDRGSRALKVRPAGGPVRPSKPSQSAKPAPKAAKTSTWRSDLSPFRSGTGSPDRSRKR